jgi:hypothetical protein
MTETLAPSSDPNVCRVTLVGPAARHASRSLLRFTPWYRPEWRKLIVQLQVGSERCPDWDHANLCLTAIQDLVKLSDGFLTDEVIDALRTHMDVVTYETFRGPPR